MSSFRRDLSSTTLHLSRNEGRSGLGAGARWRPLLKARCDGSGVVRSLGFPLAAGCWPLRLALDQSSPFEFRYLLEASRSAEPLRREDWFAVH